jgi:hypothetical protein
MYKSALHMILMFRMRSKRGLVHHTLYRNFTGLPARPMTANVLAPLLVSER